MRILIECKEKWGTGKARHYFLKKSGRKQDGLLLFSVEDDAQNRTNPSNTRTPLIYKAPHRRRWYVRRQISLSLAVGRCRTRSAAACHKPRCPARSHPRIQTPRDRENGKIRSPLTRRYAKLPRYAQKTPHNMMNILNLCCESWSLFLNLQKSGVYELNFLWQFFQVWQCVNDKFEYVAGDFHCFYCLLFANVPIRHRIT